MVFSGGRLWRPPVGCVAGWPSHSWCPESLSPCPTCGSARPTSRPRTRRGDRADRGGPWGRRGPRDLPPSTVPSTAHRVDSLRTSVDVEEKEPQRSRRTVLAAHSARAFQRTLPTSSLGLGCKRSCSQTPQWSYRLDLLGDFEHFEPQVMGIKMESVSSIFYHRICEES